MIVVSDTTPLISLMKISQLNLLYHLFKEVWIPDAVYRELVSNINFSAEAEQIEKCPYIKKMSVSDQKSVDLLRKITGLDAGESEAIILSDTEKADILLMDEVKGRQVAKQLGLQLMGTIGILLAAYEDRLLSAEDIEKCIDILKSSGRHISNKLYEQLMNKLK